MIRTLIIGNGFDLSLGLPTSYDEFVKSKFFTAKLTNNSLFKYLQEKFKEANWIDIENELKYILESITKNQDLNSNWDFNNDYFFKYYLLEKEYKELKLILNEYLSSINYIEILNNKLTAKLEKEQIDGIDVIESLLPTRIENVNINIISFNYTDTYHICEKYIPKSSYVSVKYFPIHNKINSDIIFGVNDLDYNIDDELVFLFKSSNSKYGFYKPERILDSSKQIVFYGFSLGKTDINYFEKLFTEAQNKEFIFYYYGEKGKKDIDKGIYNYTKNGVNRFKKENDIIFKDVSKIN